MKMEQSVSKRRHIKFRSRGITQRKTYNIQNTAKVWNQEYYYIAFYVSYRSRILKKLCSGRYSN